MKINNQTVSVKNKDKTAFKAGMTYKIANEIQAADVFKISDNMAKKGIDNDFKGNKIIAWCSNKVIEIFENINRMFNENITFPKSIYVENFQNLNIKFPNNISGFCNFFPTRIYKNSNKITGGNVIMFNTFENTEKFSGKMLYDWNNINEISDIDYYLGQAATPHFLNTFMHEFAHAAHENNILEKRSGNSLLELFEKSLSEKNIQKFSSKNGNLISENICNYAVKSPFEAIACDISQKIAKSLNDDLELISNPFENTIYSTKKTKNSNKSSLDKLMEKIWNGKF